MSLVKRSNPHDLARRHAPAWRSGQFRAGTWMLLGLLLLSTLAPAISRTLDHGRPLAARGWVEVCSAHGTTWVHVDGAPQPRLATLGVRSSLQIGLLLQLDACGYCAVGMDRGTPPPDFSGWGTGHRLPDVPPACADTGLFSLDCATTWARGPPVVS